MQQLMEIGFSRSSVEMAFKTLGELFISVYKVAGKLEHDHSNKLDERPKIVFDTQSKTCSRNYV